MFSRFGKSVTSIHRRFLSSLKPDPRIVSDTNTTPVYSNSVGIGLDKNSVCQEELSQFSDSIVDSNTETSTDSVSDFSSATSDGSSD